MASNPLPDPTPANAAHIEMEITEKKIAEHIPVVTSVEPEAPVKGKKASKKKEEAPPRIGYLQLFRYATPSDKLLMLVGTICALAHGTGMPLMTIIFGNLRLSSICLINCSANRPLYYRSRHPGGIFHLQP